MKSAAEINRSYYDAPSAGREDYWRYMAAPRFRVRRILSLLRPLRPGSIADLGCGNGALLAEIAAHFPAARLAGFDLSPAQLQRNTQRMPNVEWHCADLQQRNAFSAQQFDAVVASEIIEHLDDPPALLRNAYALTSDGGTLIITTQSGRVGKTERLVGHQRHFTAGELAELLRQSGWKNVRVWNEGLPFHDLSKWWANRNPEGSMDRFGARRYGVRERVICALLRAAFRLNSRRRGAQLFAVARRDP